MKAEIRKLSKEEIRDKGFHKKDLRKIPSEYSFLDNLNTTPDDIICIKVGTRKYYYKVSEVRKGFTPNIF